MEGALPYLDEGEALARRSANPDLIAQVLYRRGEILRVQGKDDEAVRL
jgi:tetratricopeptide (TPR) repeat protein